MHKDMSGKGGDPKGKYFHESVFHPHYDGRFADKQLGYRERRQALSNLIQTYLATFADIGVETWLMHGTLLGWWWNRKVKSLDFFSQKKADNLLQILPWDSDSDVQVSEASMHYLASYYNMTVFHYKTPRIPEGRDYMLEVNPHYTNREQTDKLNVIDARWTDTTSGLFIDITTARYNLTHPAGEGMLSCKDGHEYRDSYIFPLRDTFFEGAPAKIPFAYKEILEAEYKQKALTLTDFEGHHFDENKLEWIPVPKKTAEEIKKEEKKKADDKKIEEEKKKKEEEDKKKKEENEKKEKAEQAKPPPPPPPSQPKSSETPPANQQPAPQSKPATSNEAPKNQQPPNNSQSSEAPPVSKQPSLSQPSEQKRAEDKVFTKDEKRETALKKAEEKRKEDEQKAVAAEAKNV
jgi:hypothetical protein